MYNPEYVLILSGDHIYKMNYAKMIAAHRKTGAACTIAAYDVPIADASRFGILNVNADNSIYEFEEKPKKPKSTLASMGIYVFTAEKLYKYLEEDDKKTDTQNDFGKNVLPSMLAAGEKMFAFNFSGYWKDVGTIASLYDANMDLLGENPEFDITDTDWRLHSRNPIAPPHYIGETGKVVNSLVSLGCVIEGTVENSILSNNVVIKKGAVVKNSVIFSDTVVEEGAKIGCAIIDEQVVVGKNAKVGEVNDEKKISVVGREYNLPEGEVVAAGDMVEL